MILRERLRQLRWNALKLQHLDRAIEVDEPELGIVPALLSAQGLALDVGANAGLYCRAFSKAGARVIAFEPLPERLRPIFARFPICELAWRLNS